MTSDYFWQWRRVRLRPMHQQAEGRLRRHIYTNGQYYDELIFGLTREEFDDLLSRLESDDSPSA